MTEQHPSEGDGIWRDLVALALLAVLGLAVGWPRYLAGLEIGDEGVLAYGAVRVMEGQIPNRDFVSVQPPLSFYTGALMFKLFGTSLASLRHLGLAIYLGIPLLVYALSRTIHGRKLSFAAAAPALALGLPYFQFVPYAAWQGLTASLAAGLLLLSATLNGPRRLALPAGLLTGAVFLLRQDQGLYFAVAAGIYLLILRQVRPSPSGLKRAFILWMAGMGLVLVPWGLYWAARGAVPEMVRQLIVFPLTTYAKTSASPFPTLRSCLAFGPGLHGLLYYSGPLVLALMVVHLVRRFRRGAFGLRDARLAFIAAWSALFYCQVLTRSDLCHLLITLPPFFLLYTSAAGVLFARLAPKPWAAKITAGALVAGVLGFVWLVKPILIGPATPASDTVKLARGGVRVPGASNLKDLVETVQRMAPPDRSILCLPYQPTFYFLCERRNPTRWNFLWPGDQTPAEHQALIEQARKDPPAVVILTAEGDFQKYAPSIVDYVHAEYKLAGDAGGLILIYTRQ